MGRRCWQHARRMPRAYVQAAVGRANEAIRTVQKAIESAPTVWRFHATLAVLYTIVDRLDETRRELEEARKVARTNASWYLDIIQAAVAGEADEPYRLLRSAVQAKHLTRVDIGRDANLVILLEEDRLAEFAA